MQVMGRKKKAGVRRMVSFRLPTDLLDQMDKLAEGTRRTVTAEVEMAFESHLEKAGLWPVEEEPEED